MENLVSAPVVGRRVDTVQGPRTDVGLLERLRGCEDTEAWGEFYDLYSPLIAGQARHAGLNEEEARDAVQETILAVAKAISTYVYRPEKHTFREWLFRLASWKIADQARLRSPASNQPPRDAGVMETASMDDLPDPHEPAIYTWSDEEWAESLLAAAIQNTKRQSNPKYYQIYDLVVFKTWSPRKVAKTLRVNLARVYLAKFRIQRTLEKECGALSIRHEGQPMSQALQKDAAGRPIQTKNLVAAKTTLAKCLRFMRDRGPQARTGSGAGDGGRLED